MNIPVGYYIYIPDSYLIDSEKRFRTVYYLHGGRPGNEARSVYISKFLERNFTQTSLDPALYIFVNGGELSHYDSEEKNSFGEKVFIKELIPHIDKEYRTIAKRHARGLEGVKRDLDEYFVCEGIMSPPMATRMSSPQSWFCPQNKNTPRVGANAAP